MRQIDLELTIDPALPPGGIFGTMIFLYFMVCSIQKKMIAKLCWGFKELFNRPLKYVTTSNAIFCIFNYKTSMYQVIQIHKTFTSLGASHITP